MLISSMPVHSEMAIAASEAAKKVKKGSKKFEDTQPKYFHFAINQEFHAPHIIAGIVDKVNNMKVPKLGKNHPVEQQIAFNTMFRIVAALASLDHGEDFRLPASQSFIVDFDGDFQGMKDEFNKNLKSMDILLETQFLSMLEAGFTIKLRK